MSHYIVQIKIQFYFLLLSYILVFSIKEIVESSIALTTLKMSYVYIRSTLFQTCVLKDFIPYRIFNWDVVIDVTDRSRYSKNELPVSQVLHSHNPSSNLNSRLLLMSRDFCENAEIN